MLASASTLPASKLTERNIKMKTQILALGAIATAISSIAHARSPMLPTGGDRMQTILTCREARPIIDAGLLISVRQGGIVGMTQIALAQQSIMGPQPMGTVIAQGQGQLSNGAFVYLAHDLVLSVDMTTTPSMNGNTSYPARIIGSYGTAKLAHDMVCHPAQAVNRH